jgi:predicted transposase/invertase (TIGR01784 family)
MDETENTDFIYYGATELVGWHSKKPLVLHGAIAKGAKAPVVTAREVFPEYYLIYVEKFQDMINEAIDEWVYFFKHGKIRDDFKSPGIQLAARKLDYLALDEAGRRAYENYLAYLGQELSIINTAKEEGKNEGKLETAKNFLLMGMDVETVAKGTKLPVEQIRKLQKSLLN